MKEMQFMLLSFFNLLGIFNMKAFTQRLWSIAVVHSHSGIDAMILFLLPIWVGCSRGQGVVVEQNPYHGAIYFQGLAVIEFFTLINHVKVYVT